MFLADTNVISEPRQLRPEPRVLAWLERFESELFISVVTLAELQSGICQLPEGPKRRALEGWLRSLREHREAILSFDEGVALAWGEMDASLRKTGRPIPARDSFLAATALRHSLTIATRNEKDFTGTGVKTVNPWRFVKDKLLSQS